MQQFRHLYTNTIKSLDDWIDILSQQHYKLSTSAEYRKLMTSPSIYDDDYDHIDDCDDYTNILNTHLPIDKHTIRNTLLNNPSLFGLAKCVCE